MTDKLPRYEISIDPKDSQDGEKLGITQVAYTDDPAIITKGLAFNGKKMKYSDELKMRVAAPALIPNLPIYRFDEEFGEYEVIFSKETIEELRADFMLNKGSVVFNLDHDATKEAPSYILDSWITGDPKTDPSFTKYGVELPEGSWFVVSQFTDKDYFQSEIIDKDRAAYSIEGFLGLALSKIKQKLKTEKMEENVLMLPDGEHTIGEKVYVVENGVIIEIKDDVVLEEKVEEKVEEVEVELTDDEDEVDDKKVIDEIALEVELAEDEVVEEVVEEEITDEQVNAEIFKLMQPKFDEIYLVIAELKTLIETDKVKEEEFSAAPLTRLERIKVTLSNLK
jgi:hypothetical protein